MTWYRRFQLLATALLVLSSMLSPFATLAQQATPVYDETPTPTEQTTVVPDVKPTDEVDDDPPATPSPTAPVTLTPLMRTSGLGIGLLSTGGPQVTVNGSTADAVLQSGTVVNIGIPDGAEAARYGTGDCTETPGSWAQASYPYVFGGGVFSVQARSTADTSLLGPCVKIISIVAPNITFDGSLGPIYVLAGYDRVLTEFPAGSEWARFSDAACTVTTTTWTNAVTSISEGDPTTAWFQARDVTYPQFRGTCVEVNWVNLPTIAINGSTGQVNLALGANAVPSFSPNSAWNSYAGAGCNSANTLQTGSTSTSPMTSESPVTRSYRAYLVPAPTFQGNCVTVTWRSATPTLTINGQTETAFVRNGVSVTPVIPGGAEWAVYTQADCQGPIPTAWYTSGPILGADGSTQSFRARWTDEHEALGNCVNVTWRAAPTISIDGQTAEIVLPAGGYEIVPGVPDGAEWKTFPAAGCADGVPATGWLAKGESFSGLTSGHIWLQARWASDPTVLSNCLHVSFSSAQNAPVMTVAGSTNATVVIAGTDFNASSSTGSEWAAFENETCTEDQGQAWLTQGRTLNVPDPGTWSFRARLISNTTVTSPCVLVTFVNLPTLTAAGSTGPITVRLETSVWIASSPGANWNYYWSADCSGDVAGFGTSGFGFSRNEPSTLSFQPYVIAAPSIVGNCVTVTWDHPPTVLLNGQPNSLVTQPGTNITPSVPAGAEYAVSQSAVCGDALVQGWRTTSLDFTKPTNGTYSAQARWIGDENSTGPCLTITFADKAPMAVNGSTGPLTLANGSSAVPSFPEGAEWAMFSGEGCEGDPINSWSKSTGGVVNTDGTWSFRARWGTNDGTQGNCVTVNWTYPPTPLLYGQPNSQVIPLFTFITASAPPGAEYAVFRSEDCSGDIFLSWRTNASPFSSNIDYVLSIQARWANDPSALGPCLTVTFRANAPITVNGSAGPLTLLNGTTAVPAFPNGAQWAVFSGAICEGDPIIDWSPSTDGVAKSDGTWSFRARWGTDDGTRGNCVAVTWRAAPTLKVNGNSTPFAVPFGMLLTASVDHGAEVGVFLGDSCVGEPYSWHPTSFSTSTLMPGVTSFQARWSGYDGSRGDCLSVTVEPVSIPILASRVCGNNNDVITLPKTQTGITFSDSGWLGNHRTIVLSDISGYTFPSNQQTVFEFIDDGPCVTDAPIPPVQTAVCGIDNDTVTVSGQPANVLMTQSEAWSGSHTWTVTFSAAEHHALPNGTQTEYVFTDGGPCGTDAPIPPVQTAVCGIDNDTVTIPDQPANVLVTQSETWSGSHTWTVTFSASAHYVLPDDTKTQYVFTDAGPCVTDAPIPPVQQAVCGINNDTLTIPDQPASVLVGDTGWANGERTITFSTAQDHVLPNGTQTKYVFTDTGLCVTDAPIMPAQAAVCGVDNDTVTVPVQPANVVVDDTGWADGKRTVTFSAAEHYVLPDDVKTEYVFTDAGPCLTDAPLPPVQVAICGPDNDTVTLAQTAPQGISLDSDTGWIDNARMIAYAIEPGYAVVGATTFALTDANDPCPPETQQAIVQLETSDGGSVEGAPYGLYAPVASQLTDVTPYMEGTIGAGNQIVLNDLTPGSYRITINAVGYEPVDEVIVIKDVVGVQTIALRIQAMQVPTPEPTAASPTPEPTVVSPTPEPTLTPEPTASVATPGTTPQPTASGTPTDATTPQPTTTTAVSGLPVTGSGGNGGFIWLATALFGLALMAVGVGMKRPQRKQLS
ncbi:MAG: hypothetical protein M9950_12325 [Thermomicrobiales bacterium]|nr:hypothetical protein [Thermomicrobiales bacterium]